MITSSDQIIIFYQCKYNHCNSNFRRWYVFFYRKRFCELLLYRMVLLQFGFWWLRFRTTIFIIWVRWNLHHYYFLHQFVRWQGFHLVFPVWPLPFTNLLKTFSPERSSSTRRRHRQWPSQTKVKRETVTEVKGMLLDYFPQCSIILHERCF